MSRQRAAWRRRRTGSPPPRAARAPTSAPRSARQTASRSASRKTSQRKNADDASPIASSAPRRQRLPGAVAARQPLLRHEGASRGRIEHRDRRPAASGASVERSRSIRSHLAPQRSGIPRSPRRVEVGATASRRDVGLVLLGVGDVPGRRVADVDGCGGGDLVARLRIRVDDVRLRHDGPQLLDESRRERAAPSGRATATSGRARRRRSGAARAPRRARRSSRASAAARGRRRARRARRRRRSRSPRRGRRSASAYPKSPGYCHCRTIPATSASGTTKRPSSAASTPIPPASANENGMNPASRRDCESETTSENGVKSHGTSVIAKTASEPPTT